MANTSFLQRPTQLVRLEIGKVLAQFRSGVHRSAMIGRGVDVRSIRPYDPSDSPSIIDYMVSARVSDDPELQPMSRVYFTEKEISVVALVDVGASMAFMPRKMEYANILSWLFALSAFASHDRFRFISFGNRSLDDSGWIFHEDILQKGMAWTTFPIGANNTYCADALSYVAGLNIRDAVIVMISDFAFLWDRPQAILRCFGFLEHNVTMILFLLDEWSDFRSSAYGMNFTDHAISAGMPQDMREGRSLCALVQAACAHFQDIEQSVKPLSVACVRIPLLSDPLHVTHRELTRMGFV